ncbi:HAMP domain-containing protein [Betaproteobacteria bacterium PRO7]|jgi:two-component system sensor histidine kinase TctE|nr:HAMP domain-containing protein [Betaproteobacteria bacterium PRO7]GIL06859.1 MAG: histidine kinase [Betaproteobacteria bacterium]
MKPGFRHRLGLRRTLLVILLPAMLLVAAGQIWLTWRTAVDAANAAYDRSLFGAIKAIDANISTDSGGIGVELPYRLLEFFELTAGGNVYYRIATEDGLVELGNADLPRPKSLPASGSPHFSDATYFGERVRIATYTRPLGKPIGAPTGEQRIVIQVAESVTSRNEFTRALVIEAIRRDVLLIAVGAALLILLVNWVMKPLRRLRREVLARAPEDLAPIDATAAPREVAPLVDAINHHVQRIRELVEQRRRFIDDASHQLRTPLATLSAQMAYALRERDAQRVRDALLAIKLQLDDTVHRTNQMLALARADTAAFEPGPLDLNALAEEVTRESWNDARDKDIDLGFEAADGAPIVRGHDGLLREALRNLLHNALKYTPRGGHVTVHVARRDSYAELSVVDSGPGIPAAERVRAGERFFRASNVTASGSGLGLAIVRSVAQRLGGAMRVESGPDDAGCAIAVELPLWPGDAPPSEPKAG